MGFFLFVFFFCLFVFNLGMIACISLADAMKIFASKKKRGKLLFQAAFQVFSQDFFLSVVVRNKPTNFITKEEESFLGHSNINQCLGF